MTDIKLGSDAWTNGLKFYEQTTFLPRFKYFAKHFLPEKLCAFASDRYREIHGSNPTVKCHLVRAFEMGYHNMVFKIVFDDGTLWIAKIRMPPITDFERSRPAEERRLDMFWVKREMEAEIAVILLLRKHGNDEHGNNTIPYLLNVYGYNTAYNNSDCGFPFILMDYVHGITAEELVKQRRRRETPEPDTPESQSEPSEPTPASRIPVQFEEHYFRQLAKFIVGLASIEARRCGSVICQPSRDCGFVIGPFLDTGYGHYTSAADYFDAYGKSLLNTFWRDEDDRGQNEVVKEYKRLRDTLPLNDDGIFRLTHRDLSPHKVIVDKDFNILSVIGWLAVQFLPRPCLHQPPPEMDLDFEWHWHGSVAGEPIASQRLRNFFEIVEERGRYLFGTSSFLTSHGYFSKEALAWSCVNLLRIGITGYNLAALKLLGRCSDQDLEEFATADF